MPEKPATRSAENPAGPVTYTVTPIGQTVPSPSAATASADVGVVDDGHEGLSGETVIRGDHGETSEVDIREVGGSGDRVTDRRELVFGELRLSDEHDDRRDGIGLVELRPAAPAPRVASADSGR